MDNKQLLDFLRGAIKYSDDVSRNYILLEEFEKNKLRDTYAYGNIKSNLMQILNSETQFYERASLNAQDTANLISILIEQKNINPHISFEERLINNNFDFSPFLRVFYKLDYIYTHNEGIVESKFNKTPFSKLFDASDLSEQIQNTFKIKDAVFNDYYLVFLSFLESHLINNDNNYIRHVKYLLPFLYPTLENFFVKNNFVIPNSLYLNHQLFFDMLKIPDDGRDFMIYTDMRIKFFKQIDGIIKYQLHESGTDNAFEIILRNYFVRSWFVILSDEIVDILEETKDELFDAIAKRDPSLNALEEIKKDFELIKKDKSLHKYLSLKP